MNTPCISVRLAAKSGNPYVGSMCINAAKQHSLGTSHHRNFFLAIATLLTVPLGFNSAAHAQDASTAPSAQG
jgi:hypothetical protein